MKLRMALEEKIYDSRIRDRFVAEGKVDPKEVQQYLDNLEDDSAKAKTLQDNRRENLNRMQPTE